MQATNDIIKSRPKKIEGKKRPATASSEKKKKIKMQTSSRNLKK